ARKLQDLCRTDGSGRKHDLAPAAQVKGSALPAAMDAPYMPAVEFQPMRLDSGENAQVLTARRRAEKSARAGGTPAAPGGQLEAADALLLRAVEVLIERQPGLLASLKKARDEFQID